MSELLSVSELVEVLKINKSTLYRWLKEGLPAEMRRPNKFIYEDVKEWINNREAE